MESMASDDFYQLLGVDKSASAEEIKKAYRKAAVQHHPDKGGDEEHFKKITEAYEVLKDPQKRKAYDQFGKAGVGGGAGGGTYGNPFQGFEGFSGFGGAGGTRVDLDFEDLGDIFGSFFGGAARAARGRDVETAVSLDFNQAIFGDEVEVESIGGRSVKVKVPPGIDDGSTLRIRGGGEQIESGRHGDLYIRVRVRPHLHGLKRDGRNVRSDVTIPLTAAVLGGETKVHTVDGEVSIKIPPGSQNNQELKISGKGVPFGDRDKRGDHIITLQIELPKRLSKKQKDAFEAFAKTMGKKWFWQ